MPKASKATGTYETWRARPERTIILAWTHDTLRKPLFPLVFFRSTVCRWRATEAVSSSVARSAPNAISTLTRTQAEHSVSSCVISSLLFVSIPTSPFSTTIYNHEVGSCNRKIVFFLRGYFQLITTASSGSSLGPQRTCRCYCCYTGLTLSPAPTPCFA